ncbi:hypothetical protein CUN63_01175 [Pseudomonas sp. ACM7]|nr:hypothetical protein CUN63_01175 [Pseudomonas sp. ACM7]
MFVDGVIAGFVPTGVTVSRLFWKLTELLWVGLRKRRNQTISGGPVGQDECMHWTKNTRRIWF